MGQFKNNPGWCKLVYNVYYTMYTMYTILYYTMYTIQCILYMFKSTANKYVADVSWHNLGLGNVKTSLGDLSWHTCSNFKSTADN